jgi:hypothetical protein
VARFVKDTDLGLKRFMREMRAANRAFVTVGVHQGERNMEGTDIAEYATYNEYGTEDIPSRPFMRTSFDENVATIQSDMNMALASAKAGGSVVAALKTVGERHQQRIQRTIKGRDFLPKLADSTIAAKKGSTKTLIDSGSMANSIRYVVHK